MCHYTRDAKVCMLLQCRRQLKYGCGLTVPTDKADRTCLFGTLTMYFIADDALA
jgi:hypothetical protein